jgi:GcrA cell cycle regulator
MDWTEETIARLRGMWTEGHSTAEIGRRLGVTKNAVVGKAHRLDLPARPSPIRRDGVPGTQPRRTALRRVAGPTLPPLSSTSPAPGPVVAAASDVPALVSVVAPPLESGHSENDHSENDRPENGRPAIDPPELLQPEAGQPGPSHPQPLPAALSPAAIRPVPHAFAPAARMAAAPRPYARSVTCCWPIGEPGTRSFRFCDDGAAPGKPYCAPHAAIAYVKVRDRREDAA